MENSLDLLYNSKKWLINLIDTNSSINKLPQKNDIILPIKSNSNINKNILSIKYSILQAMSDISDIFNNYGMENSNIYDNLISKELSFYNKKNSYMVTHKINYDSIENHIEDLYNNININIEPIIESESQKLISNKKINKINKEINKNLPHLIAKKSLNIKDTLIEKSRIKNYSYNILGKEENNLIDPEIYEDYDLKNLFLKDLKSLEDDNSDNLIINYKAILDKKKYTNKSKNRLDYDSKASKDRKIKFEIMEKLVNFMIPEENNKISGNRDNIITNLFGNSSNDTSIPNNIKNNINNETEGIKMF